ncbi:MAG TPA: DUF302 domain-containing protein [Myxococcaceae bacterium]|jgi:uncharacterized protein (DUF302 family)|nr:DUF302 domain-containing protein [Myxococcaceae bacterium]
MATHDVAYGYTRVLPGVGYDDAVKKVTEALKKEGFGVLTTIDVKETLKQKIGADFRRYVILGACNPQLAHRALGTELGVGLLLPCNVTVFEGDDGKTVVQVVKPHAMLAVVRRPELEAIAGEADQRLQRALAAV